MLRIFLSRPFGVLSCSSRHAYSAQAFPVPTFRRLQLHYETQGTVLSFFLSWLANTQLNHWTTRRAGAHSMNDRDDGALQRAVAVMSNWLKIWIFNLLYSWVHTFFMGLWVSAKKKKLFACVYRGPFGHGTTPSALPPCYSSILGHRNCQIETAVWNWAGFFTVL